MLSGEALEQPDGATPLEHDDLAGLIPTWVATQQDLNQAEHANIAKAILWAESGRGPRSLETLLTEKAIRDLHRRMFAEVWTWAGQYRHHNTNLGDEWPYIPTRLHDLLADVAVQTSDLAALPWDPDELAVRFHHRLVSIHPFANGNGRHARLAADILATLLGRPPFSWGAGDLGTPGSGRAAYLAALREADRTQDYTALIEFARS